MIMKNTINSKVLAFARIVSEEFRDWFAYYSAYFGWSKSVAYSDTPIYDQLEREWANNKWRV
jgi:hypothetical protein